jgi:S1-C subfamily serine protease
VEENDDLLLMSVKPSQKLPAQTLPIRDTPVQIGESVFLIGVPYSEPQSAQNVYRGVVTQRGFEDRFRYKLSPPVDLRGFSGAPIVDADGRVVGIMTIWFNPDTVDGKHLDGGGEDIATALKHLKNVSVK